MNRLGDGNSLTSLTKYPGASTPFSGAQRIFGDEVRGNKHLLGVVSRTEEDGILDPIGLDKLVLSPLVLSQKIFRGVNTISWSTESIC